MITRMQKALHLREILVPFVQQHGHEVEGACADGKKHRQREAKLGRFDLHYETPFHGNPGIEVANFAQARYLQENPHEDYKLRVYSSEGCHMHLYWLSKTGAARITTFGSRASGWYEEILSELERYAKAA